MNIDLRLLRCLPGGAALLVVTALVAAPPPVKVIATEIKAEPFTDRLEALGTTSANESVELTATVTETVSVVHFDDSDRVETGQVLVEMTSSEEHAQLEEARSTVNEARRQFERIRSLESKGTAAKSLLDERRREWETASARLAAIESRLADRLIKAPFAGLLGLRDISVGALVQPGDLITTLDDDSVMKLDFPVPGTALDAITPGLEVNATSRATPGHLYAGTVKSVDSRIDPVTRSVRVRALLPNPERLLKPGMLLQVTLLSNPREALIVPEEALIPTGEKHFVYLIDTADNNKATRREVRIGGRIPGKVEVIEGLQAGDMVVSQGTLKVRPGQPVDIIALDDGTRTLAEMLRAIPDGQ
ncbi:MAG: efflux RND transporter periplasmic adaptor subunit [Gammaproteobacteria bacterium]